MHHRSLWIHSPHLLIHEALASYVLSLGFGVQDGAEGAAAAVFDLTSFQTPFPPAPPIPCLAIVRTPDPHVADEIGELGYRSVLGPDEGPDRFSRALRELLEQERAVAGPADPAPADPPCQEPPQLTARETQVLGLLMLGLPNKRIASRLGITERTTKFHVSSLMKKYQTRGRLSLLVKSRMLEGS
jgi:DNA-binding NarL/FixJ family response regulator